MDYSFKYHTVSVKTRKSSSSYIKTQSGKVKPPTMTVDDPFTVGVGEFLAEVQVN